MRSTPPILLEALQHYLLESFPDKQFIIHIGNWSATTSRWYIHTTGVVNGNSITIYDDGVLGQPNQVSVLTHKRSVAKLEFQADLRDSRSCDLIAEFIKNT